MKVGEALPHIFNRSYPILEPRTQMLLAVSLLRFHQIDALPIGFKRLERKRYAVFGYSTLSKLLQTKPSEYGKFLERPCEIAALELSTIPATREVESLLRTFKASRFGFAWAEGKFEAGGFASLREVLMLYEKEIISTEMSVGDVASPIVSMDASTTLKDAINEMFDLRFRRMFVRGTNKVISDRKIIGYVFSSSRLSEVCAKPQTLLDANLGNLEAMNPEKVSAKSKIKDAASVMRGQIEECLVCEKGVLTPWDLVMKPWLEGKLEIRA